MPRSACLELRGSIHTFCFPTVFVNLLGVSLFRVTVGANLQPLRSASSWDGAQGDLRKSESGILRREDHIALPT